MSSRFDLEALDKLHAAISGNHARLIGLVDRSDWDCAIQRAYPALRDEIKRLRLELAAKKQHVRACHAVAHGTIGKADDALREAARLEVEAKRTTEKGALK